MNFQTQKRNCMQNVILVRFENQYAVLQNEQGIEYFWPVSELPETINQGETLVLSVKTIAMQKEEEFERMRTLLTELIN
jgi:hypothetical protein